MTVKSQGRLAQSHKAAEKTPRSYGLIQTITFVFLPLNRFFELFTLKGFCPSLRLLREQAFLTVRFLEQERAE